MKKKVLSILLCAAMTVVMFTGCGKASDGGDGTSAAKEGTSAPAAASGEEDHVIRIGAVCAMTGGSAIYGEGAQNQRW